MNIYIPRFTDTFARSKYDSQFVDPDELRYLLSSVEAESLAVTKWVETQRVIPLSYGDHVRGVHPVRTGHPPVLFESKLEASTISSLVVLPGFEGIQSQPVTVHYRWHDKSYRYTPDLRVQLRFVPDQLRRLGFGFDTFVEVKPLKRAWRDQMALHRRFTAMRTASYQPIVLVTDQDLPHLLEEVRRGH
jgi:hypothetical protein